MAQIEYVHHRTYSDCYVTAESIDAAIEAAIPMIRQKSRAFYRRELRASFDAGHKCLVDLHAGQGNYIHLSVAESACTEHAK